MKPKYITALRLKKARDEAKKGATQKPTFGSVLSRGHRLFVPARVAFALMAARTLFLFHNYDLRSTFQQAVASLNITQQEGDARVVHTTTMNNAEAGRRASQINGAAPAQNRSLDIRLQHHPNRPNGSSIKESYNSGGSDQEPVICTHNETTRQCCGTWEVSADEWWLHNPDWEITLENETNFCFSPMRDPNQAAFLQNLHKLQWHSNCSNLETTTEINSGLGASVGWLLVSFFHAYGNNHPFQIVATERRWLYATTNSSYDWAYCDTEDTQCYWLPISNCSRVDHNTKGFHLERRWNGQRKQAYEMHWLRKYMTRPRQKFRRKMYETKQGLSMKYPCIAMHVRRGDAGLEASPFRRYAAVQEYIDAAHIQKGDNIFLMTDDESTLEEIERHLNNTYNWMFLKRPRSRGIPKMNGHVVSEDASMDMLAMEVELRAAKSCNAMVYGSSSFIGAILVELDLEGRNYTRYGVETGISRTEAKKYGGDLPARIQSHLEAIEALYRQRAQNKSTNDAVVR